MTLNPNEHDDTPSTDQEQGPARPASVQLRTGDNGPRDGSLMDSANQSLADALRITYRILQWAMVVLAILYVGSGFQSVKTSERGVRLSFGRIAAQDLRPGFQFAWPYPFGELVKVDVANQDLEVNKAFWPYVKPGDEAQSIDQLRAKAALSIDQDGSILTGDGAIAHTQWKVQYARTDARAFAQHVYPGHETGIVLAAAQRGIVQAVAGVSIDDLLKQSASDAESVAIRARAIAQATLNSEEISTGIEIEQLSLTQKIPPAYLLESFSSVNDADNNASKARENAQKERNTLLSDTAGGAAPILIQLIDEYERQIDAGETEQAQATLAQIDRVFDSQPIQIDGAEVTPSIGGEVASMLSAAVQYRSGVVDRARSDLAVFQAKLAQYKTNPEVMVTADWTGALAGFFGDERIEIFFHPTGADTLELVINTDPEIAADRERRMLAAQNDEARRQREQLRQRSRYETEEGLRLVPN